jgi:hypothetical protein
LASCRLCGRSARRRCSRCCRWATFSLWSARCTPATATMSTWSVSHSLLPLWPSLRPFYRRRPV